MWPFDEAIDTGPPNPFTEPDTAPRWSFWSEDEWFDLIELLHDLVSQPTDGRYHDFSECGWHFSEFDQAAGRSLFREEISYVLGLGDPTYELNADGEIMLRAPEAFQPLLDAVVPEGTDEDSITAKIASAQRDFRARRATRADKQHAVRDLADVLERLRPDKQAMMLSADEGALFSIANNFGIRHNNRAQHVDYDDEVWLRWMFYVYLATVHAVLRIRARQ
jgi:hypothetical protein